MKNRYIIVMSTFLISHNALFCQNLKPDLRYEMRNFLISTGDADTNSGIFHPYIIVEQLLTNKIFTSKRLSNIPDGLYGFGPNTEHSRHHIMIVCNHKYYFVNMSPVKNTVLKNVDSLFVTVNCFSDSLKSEFIKIISYVHYQNWLYSADLHLLPYYPYAVEELDEIEIIEEETEPLE